ncbi:hypothetical protein [Pseudomonas sp. RT6P73]
MNQNTIVRRPGDRDRSFGVDGEVTLSILPDEIHYTRLIKGVLALPDNRILLSMTLETKTDFGQYGLAILTSEGELDKGFNNGSLLIGSFEGDAPCDGGRLLRLADGRLLMLGAHIEYSGPEPINHLAVACFSSDYSPEKTFGVSGTGHLVIENQPDEICMTNDSRVAEQADGKILICTTYHQHGNWRNTTGVLYRLLPDGKFDTTLNGTGRLDFKMQDPSTPTGLSALLPQANGTIVVAGYGALHSETEIALFARFDDKGVLDPEFGSPSTPGYCGIEVDNHPTRFNGLLSTNQGFVGLGQAGESGIPDTKGMLAGITKNGLPDPDFNHGKPLITKYDKNRENAWLDGYVQLDGKLVISAARHYIYISRWLPDGTHDPEFGIAGLVKEDFSNVADPVIVGVRPDNTFFWAGNPIGIDGGLGKLITYFS